MTISKDILALISLLTAVALAFCATFVDPQGEIDSSMLYAIAQFLTLTATLLGIDSAILQIYKYNKKNAS